MEFRDQTLIQNEKEMLPFIMDHLPDAFQKKAEVELKETSENKVQSLSELKLMAKANHSTSGIDFHEDFLLQFLRHSKYNVLKSFSQLQSFINLRRKYSSLFRSVAAEDLSLKASYKFITVFPRRCPDGCTIVNCQIGKFDPEEMDIDDFKRMVLVLVQQLLRDPMTQINGFKFIHDFEGTSFKHLKFCTPQNLLLLYHSAMDCFPGRYKEIHCVNESVVLRALWAIVKPFLSSKMRSRVLFHSAPDQLLQYFPRSVLPVELGGDLTDYYMGDYIKEANKQFGECTIEGQANYF